MSFKILIRIIMEAYTYGTEADFRNISFVFMEMLEGGEESNVFAFDLLFNLMVHSSTISSRTTTKLSTRKFGSHL